jgi:alanyl-tRNA synthetase
MTANDIRTKYLQFFEARGHHVIPSSPLVPENDPTTLFTSSGMQPLVPYLLGQPHPEGKRLVDSQKSFRSQDIEEFGDNRHTTFFEMLGNWSLGDYFKKDQLPWVFEFLTKEIGLDPKKLYVTVFAGNDSIGKDGESVEIWKALFAGVGVDAKDVEAADIHGMQGGRIFYYPEKKNWWSRSGVPSAMPAGEPGGPDSEVFFDFGEELQLHEQSQWKDEPCHVNCDCGRFMEIGNSVFMQFQKQSDGSFKELPAKNVDFGGGLERILAAKNNDRDVFKIDILVGLIQALENLSGKTYGSDELITRSMRVIADHIRAAVMLASDGVFPSNKQQGYFSRRLLRRSIRYAHNLGIDSNFLADLVPVVANQYKDAYPNVGTQLQAISEQFEIEENKFRKTLTKGLREIEKVPTLDGHIAFHMYETYGFPLELTQEIAQERGQVVDSDQFKAEFDKHKELSRTASAGMFKGGLADQGENTLKYHTATHLLHAALRNVLGVHVQQKGSNITGERLRFDFSHPIAMTAEEKQQVEDQMNAWIKEDLPVTRSMMQKQDALKSGAIAFFIEKYPDEVSVYTIGKDLQDEPDADVSGRSANGGWISKELCGGPHVEHTGVIGPVKIFKEEAVSAGVRRIYIKLA